MNTFKRLFSIAALCTLTTCSPKVFGAFPVYTIPTVTDSPVIIRGERVYSVNATPSPRDNYNRQPVNGYRRPYKNREKEAKLAYIFGFLGLYFYPFSIPALILGIIGADRRNKYYHKAVWGIVMGALPIAIAVAALIVYLLLL